MTTPNSRTSALAEKHKDLGSGLEDWNGMGTAWSYNTDPDKEHDAIREGAGIIDMSGLKKIRVSGKDSEEVLNHVFSREIKNLQPGQSSYGIVLNDKGFIADDAIVYKNENEFIFVHGSGESMELIQESAKGKEVDVNFDDDLHDISLQGPKALEILKNHTPIDLESLKYFNHFETELFGKKCVLSRTGYSGEKGYELFVSGNDAVAVWDNILEAGKNLGVMPASFTALDKARIEAGLLFYGYDMTNEHSPWEVNLHWTMSKGKTGYRGYDAAMSIKDKLNFTNIGLNIDHNEGLAGGEEILVNDKKVGVVNSPCYSKRMGKSLALGHVAVNCSKPETAVVINTSDKKLNAIVSSLPFYDPKKTRTHS